jgi:hypothetical protein
MTGCDASHLPELEAFLGGVFGVGTSRPDILVANWGGGSIFSSVALKKQLPTAFLFHSDRHSIATTNAELFRRFSSISGVPLFSDF